MNEMNWEQKTEMIKAGNQGRCGDVIKIMSDNISTVDDQGIDMFISTIELTKNSLKPYLKEHNKILAAIHNRKTGSFRTAFRWGYYQQLIDELNNLTPTTP